jgi:hypothetical protein
MAMKNYFLLGIALFKVGSALAMDDCVSTKFLILQQNTWPLRKELVQIKKYFAHAKPCLTTEQHEKFKWHHHSISTSLDHVINQCDHARMDLSNSKFSQIEEYYKKAEAHLQHATTGLLDYKHAINNILKVDLDAKAAL